MRNSILLASAALVALPATAHAACQPVFRDGDTSITITGVDIGPNDAARENLDLRVGNDGSPSGGNCPAVIRVSRIGTATDPDMPAYLLRARPNQEVEILPAASAGGTARSDINITNAPSGAQGSNIPFQFIVPTEWGLKAGTYVEQLLFSLYDETGALTDTITVTFTITIPPAVSLRLVGAVLGGTGLGPTQVDLGELSGTRETRSPDFGARIFSTAPYSVSFTSMNQGNLLNENGHDTVGYRLYFDGQLVELAGANSFVTATHTSSTGDIHSLRVIVPPVVAVAGRYSDRVIVLVTAI